MVSAVVLCEPCLGNHASRNTSTRRHGVDKRDGTRRKGAAGGECLDKEKEQRRLGEKRNIEREGITGVRMAGKRWYNGRPKMETALLLVTFKCDTASITQMTEAYRRCS